MMRENERTTVCDLCLEYLSGLCSHIERAAFERHLVDCPGCQTEVDELQIVWEGLSENVDQIDPPEDLKKEVMAAVQALEEGREASNYVNSKYVKRKRIKRWRKWMVAVSAALAIFFSGFIWGEQSQQEEAGGFLPIEPIEQTIHVSAAQIEQLVMLKAQEEPYSSSYGISCIVSHGQIKQFIVYVFGAEATRGSQVYQVWLLQDGQRQSVGKFRVDQQGIGVLALPITSTSEPIHFEEIEITLEPDEYGDDKRGVKVFSTM